MINYVADGSVNEKVRAALKLNERVSCPVELLWNAESERAKALEEESRRKDEFIAILGHELRNPLAPIRNSLTLIRKVIDSNNPAVATSLDVLDRQSRQLGRLVDDMLDLAGDVNRYSRLACQIWLDEKWESLTVSMPGAVHNMWGQGSSGGTRSDGASTSVTARGATECISPSGVKTWPFRTWRSAERLSSSPPRPSQRFCWFCVGVPSTLFRM